jgi:hypothetical protein
MIDVLQQQPIPFEENMPYSQRAPTEEPTKYTGLAPLSRPLITPKSNAQVSEEIKKYILSSGYMEERGLPSLHKTNALSEYLSKTAKRRTF